MSLKRNKLEIIKDILNIINDKRSIKPTPLLRKSGLSSTNFKEYYQDLLSRNFIKEIFQENNKFVVLADRGYKFLESYKSIVSFIEEFDL